MTHLITSNKRFFALEDAARAITRWAKINPSRTYDEALKAYAFQGFDDPAMVTINSGAYEYGAVVRFTEGNQDVIVWENLSSYANNVALLEELVGDMPCADQDEVIIEVTTEDTIGGSCSITLTSPSDKEEGEWITWTCFLTARWHSNAHLGLQGVYGSLAHLSDQQAAELIRLLAIGHDLPIVMPSIEDLEEALTGRSGAFGFEGSADEVNTRRALVFSGDLESQASGIWRSEVGLLSDEVFERRGL